MRASALHGIIVIALALSFLAQGLPVAAIGDQGFARKHVFTKHFQETLFDITEHAAYSVEVLLDEGEYKIGKGVIGVVVHDAEDGDVKGAELTIVHKNLSTGEKAVSIPIVKDHGNGLYTVSNLDLRREGRWELAITVKKNGVEDKTKFILPDALKQRVPKGRYSP